MLEASFLALVVRFDETLFFKVQKLPCDALDIYAMDFLNPCLHFLFGCMRFACAFPAFLAYATVFSENARHAIGNAHRVGSSLHSVLVTFTIILCDLVVDHLIICFRYLYGPRDGTRSSMTCSGGCVS